LWAGINAVTGWFLVYPLTKEEIMKQWGKRKIIGKFNYSLSFLDMEDDKKDWADELAKRRRIALGLDKGEFHSEEAKH